MPAPGEKWNLAGIFDRTMKPYLLILSLVLAVSFLAGTIAPSSIRRQMTEMFQAIASNYRGLAGGMLFFNILVQNVMATIFVLISGVVVGIIPALAIGSNGFGLGVLYRQAAEVSGYWKAALKVLPFGVFEIPALLIAASYGLWLGVMVVRRMRGKESPLLRVQIEHAFRRYFAIVFPLLVVAAAIETALILRLQ
jgi:stage II sporulation protein M